MVKLLPCLPLLNLDRYKAINWSARNGEQPKSVPVHTGVLEFHDEVMLRNYMVEKPVCLPVVLQRRIQ